MVQESPRLGGGKRVGYRPPCFNLFCQYKAGLETRHVRTFAGYRLLREEAIVFDPWNKTVRPYKTKRFPYGWKPLLFCYGESLNSRAHHRRANNPTTITPKPINVTHS
jgi:hypothetical protein